MRRAAVLACLAFALATGVDAARAQGPVTLDPSVAGQGTALLLAADESILSSDGRPADSVTFAVARGTRLDTAAREKLCSRAQAARSACPPSTRIGFGRFVMAVRGYLLGFGEAELAWSTVAYLGQPLERGDAASVVLTGNLLGAGSIATLLAPALGTTLPTTTTTVGRLIQRRSGPYGVELRFAKLPVQLEVAAPITAAPARLEVALTGVRRVRQDFTRRINVRTPSGYEVRKVRDHRLIGHHLVRAPRSCKGSWASEVRAVFGTTQKRTRSRITCFTAG